LKSGENLSINLILCTLAAFADFKRLFLMVQ